jgi:hypothetical protein
MILFCFKPIYAPYSAINKAGKPVLLLKKLKRKTAYPKRYAVYGCRDCYIWQWFVF